MAYAILDDAERATAYHESGHTVAHYRLGMCPSCVTTTDFQGNGTFTEGLAEFTGTTTAEQNIILALAGPIAEVLSKGEPLERSGKAIVDDAGRFTWTRGRARKTIIDLVTKRFVKGVAKIWSAEKAGELNATNEWRSSDWLNKAADRLADDWWNTGSSWMSDLWSIAWSLHELGYSSGREAAVLYERARDLVITDWAYIHLIAEALMRSRKLDRRAINRIMKIPKLGALALVPIGPNIGLTLRSYIQEIN